LWSDAWWLFEVPLHPAASVAGLLAALLSAWFFVRTKAIPGAQYSPCFDASLPDTIIQDGPYACIRHPIYTANIALLVAMFLATGTAWLAVNSVVLLAYYTHAARREERELCDAIPGYADYMTRADRFLPRWSPNHGTTGSRG
jgi:protein-S-isoprenylcysteine O-methyltransferase Ste14